MKPNNMDPTCLVRQPLPDAFKTRSDYYLRVDGANQMAAQLRCVGGAPNAPGMAFTDRRTGWWRNPTDGSVGLAIGGYPAALWQGGIGNPGSFTLWNGIQRAQLTTSAITGNRSYTMPDQSGVLALALNPVSVSSNYSAHLYDLVLATGGSGGITVTLPTYGTNQGIVVIKKWDSGAGAITISGTIDGSTSNSLTTQYQSIMLVPIGSGAWASVGTSAGGVTAAEVQDEAFNYGTATFASNVYSLTISPAPTMVSGLRVTFLAANTSTGAASLNVNGLGAYPLTKEGTNATVAGDIQSGAEYDCLFDGTEWQILSATTHIIDSGTF